MYIFSQRSIRDAKERRQDRNKSRIRITITRERGSEIEGGCRKGGRRRWREKKEREEISMRELGGRKKAQIADRSHRKVGCLNISCHFRECGERERDRERESVQLEV